MVDWQRYGWQNKAAYQLRMYVVDLEFAYKLDKDFEVIPLPRSKIPFKVIKKIHKFIFQQLAGGEIHPDFLEEIERFHKFMAFGAEKDIPDLQYEVFTDFNLLVSEGQTKEKAYELLAEKWSDKDEPLDPRTIYNWVKSVEDVYKMRHIEELRRTKMFKHENKK